MNAKELIGQVEECRSEHWQDSDISSGGERMLEIIAAHFSVCEDCRDAFDSEEYEEEFLIDLWHRFMCQTEDVSEWICAKGLQALFDHPNDIFIIVPEAQENAGFPNFIIELSGPALEYEIGKRWPGAEIEDDFEPCEEPEASENEYVKCALLGGEIVARIYTEGVVAAMEREVA